jgi:succinate-semialdehyde dehydrogenase/glutarate-semialdehyde dehydrogenase
VELSASILKYYADNAETFLAPRPLKSIAGEAYIEYSPLGVLVGVQPWNYPYYPLARFAAPHLASGYVMLVKHAPGVPQCALTFEQLFQEAGAPSGVYTNAFLSNDQVAKLIDDPRTRGVALTGSERAGESLAVRAGKNLKKSTMELRGSDAFIALEDYELEDAVKMAVVGRPRSSAARRSAQTATREDSNWRLPGKKQGVARALMNQDRPTRMKSRPSWVHNVELPTSRGQQTLYRCLGFG